MQTMFVARSRGGFHSMDNFLPVCAVCNRMRWDYSPDMMRIIIRLGIQAKQEVRHNTPVGNHLVRKLVRNPKRGAR